MLQGLLKFLWVPQATNFCLWATGKAYFFHIHVNLSAWHQGFHNEAPRHFSYTKPWIRGSVHKKSQPHQNVGTLTTVVSFT